MPIFAIHSTFRDGSNRKLKPEGLQWGMPGLSEIYYTPLPPILDATVPSSSKSSNDESPPDIDLESLHVRRGIVEAHNLWSFAVDLPFVTIDDILSLSKFGTKHISVKWKENQRPETMIRNIHDASDPSEVWINGRYFSMLSGPDSLPPIVEAINDMRSIKVCYRRSINLIRIEKYFRGMIRGQEVFDHLMDNLIALEDPEIIDERTIIGTVTLPDWIMGGMLTSRLWVRQLDNGNILTLRPLRNDDINTTDRRYELKTGVDDERIDLVRKELRRLRYLAGIEHPVDQMLRKDGAQDVLEEKQHGINGRFRKMRL